MKFSLDYNTYEDWLESFKGTATYRNRIVRLHSEYPHASLSQLRGHAQKGRRFVSELKAIPVYRRPWKSLSKRELSQRGKSLEAITKVKKGASLTDVSKKLHTTPKTVLRQTNAFVKIKGRYRPKQFDKISRVMSIYEKGKQNWIEIKDSRTASKIGQYNSAVKEFLVTGDETKLKHFKKPIKDSNGKLHYLEINPERLYEISEQQEEPEFFEIYEL